MGIIEFSNEAVAKVKSWELRFYRRERRKASKKLTASRTRLSAGGIGFFEDDELGGKAVRDLPTR